MSTFLCNLNVFQIGSANFFRPRPKPDTQKRFHNFLVTFWCLDSPRNFWTTFPLPPSVRHSSYSQNVFSCEAIMSFFITHDIIVSQLFIENVELLSLIFSLPIPLPCTAYRMSSSNFLHIWSSRLSSASFSAFVPVAVIHWFLRSPFSKNNLPRQHFFSVSLSVFLSSMRYLL